MSMQGKSSSSRIEAAMARAVRLAARDGISDPAEIKSRMMAARDRARQDMRDEEYLERTGKRD